MSAVPIVSVTEYLNIFERLACSSVAGARYNRIIREENLYELMQKLYEDQLSTDPCDPLIVQLLNSILHLLRPYRFNRLLQTSAVAS
jgi:hypothetical protein